MTKESLKEFAGRMSATAKDIERLASYFEDATVDIQTRADGANVVHATVNRVAQRQSDMAAESDELFIQYSRWKMAAAPFVSQPVVMRLSVSFEEETINLK